MRLTAETPAGETVVLGATRVAAGAAARGSAVLVDGRPGVLSWRADGTPYALFAFTVEGGRITAMRAVTDPARLARVDLPVPS
ncbi:MAG: hypothetical protein HOY69_00010 [Streptomyces sp.]|nr:hypothetical protein [Streptomyces sp.]